MDQRIRVSPFERTADLREGGEVIAKRTLGTDGEGQAPFKPALELGQNHHALLALLWPKRVSTPNGHGQN